MRLLNGYGINPIVITKDDILRSNKIKVLILPCCLWLSEEEIEDLSEFLVNGVIIADISPGMINNTDLANELRDLMNNRNIREEKIKNDNVFLLNESLAKNIEIEPIENVKKGIKFIQNVLKSKEIRSPYLNENEWIDGKFYSFNDKRIIVWLPNLTPVSVNNECKFNLELFKYNNKLWDVFNDKRIKAGKNVSLDIHNSQPLFICSNPYLLKEMKLAIPDVIKSGSRLPIQIELKQKGEEISFLDHWVNIELKSKGNKKEIIINSQILQTNQEGKGETYVSIPKNQPLGWYVVVAKEITTGTTIEKTIKINN